jgi:hypothetical protein
MWEWEWEGVWLTRFMGGLVGKVCVLFFLFYREILGIGFLLWFDGDCERLLI